MEFEPTGTPPRVSEPSFAVHRPDHRTDRPGAGAGSTCRPTARNQTAMPEAQCEFNQYLESLDGFPTVAGARAPVSAAVDLATATVPGQRGGGRGHQPAARHRPDGRVRPGQPLPAGGGRARAGRWAASSGWGCAATTGASAPAASRWWPRWSTTCSSGSADRESPSRSSPAAPPAPEAIDGDLPLPRAAQPADERRGGARLAGPAGGLAPGDAQPARLGAHGDGGWDSQGGGGDVVGLSGPAARR